MSIRRGCCCGGCPSALEVTFSGVDATHNTTCYSSGFGYFNGRKREWALGVLDGTYVLPHVAGSGPEACSYLLNVAKITQVNLYLGTFACSGAFNGLVPVTQIYVTYNSTSGKVTQVYVGADKVGVPPTPWAFEASGSYDLDAPIANVPTALPGPYATGGTATVSLP